MTRKRRIAAGLIATLMALLGIWFVAVRPSAEPRYQDNFATSNLLAPFAMVHRAGSALRYLGPDAVSAIPELEQLAGMESPHIIKSTAVFTLSGLGIEGWQAIGRVLKRASPTNRANLEVPVSVSSSRALRGGNLRAREEAALAMCHLDSPPYEMIPVLGDIIDTGKSERGVQALSGLAKLATNYITAIYALRRAALSDNLEIRGLAQTILNRTGYTNAITKQ
jgi:hypothetical protein